MRKHCLENGRRPPKDSVQEGELVGPVSTGSPSCQHGAQTAGHWAGIMKAAPGMWPWGGVSGGTLAGGEERFGDGCKGLPGVARWLMLR